MGESSEWVSTCEDICIPAFDRVKEAAATIYVDTLDKMSEKNERYDSVATLFSIEDGLDGQTVFLTGATGMMGTVFLARAVLDTPVTRIYALVRGGKERLWSRLVELLPNHLVQRMEAADKIVAVDGDITKPNMGIRPDDLGLIQKETTILIHSASTLHLRHGLQKIASNVIFPSLAIGRFALACPHLSKFVYVSTAYTNAWLHFHPAAQLRTESDVIIAETFYPLRTTPDPAAELANIQEFGDTPEYSRMGHPFAYSYAKHLTERLLHDAFVSAGREDALLIFRPSCFGPAERRPFPGFETPGSVPITTVMAAVFGATPTRARIQSNLPDPSHANIDEVPVDVVVDRLIAHVAFGTAGIVHAVAGTKGRRPSAEMVRAAGKRRAWWWGRPRLEWVGPDADPKGIHFIGKTFGVLGCSFLFLSEKTEQVWAEMQPEDREKWHLFRERDARDLSDFEERTIVARGILKAVMRKRHGVPRWAASLLVKKPKCIRPGCAEKKVEERVERTLELGEKQG